MSGSASSTPSSSNKSVSTVGINARCAKNAYGMPCLFRACQKGDLAVVVQHVSLNFPGPKVANNAASALYIACCEGHTDIVRILMDSQQFDPNQKNYR